jgi:hypothetical protein
MIHVIRSQDRYAADHGWLQTRWHFSFSDYHDPANMNWGALRVFNDDVIQPAGGFPMHRHHEMEIITWVLEGALEHRDSLGNSGVIRPGEVQVMSAGRGIRHSEYNHSKTEPLRLLQLWVLPRTAGLEPRWEQRPFTAAARAGKLLPVVSGGDLPGTLRIDQDAAIYLSSLAAGQQVGHGTAVSRKPYLFVTQGEVELAGSNGAVTLAAGDQARIAGESQLTVRASKDADLILLDLPDIQ